MINDTLQNQICILQTPGFKLKAAVYIITNNVIDFLHVNFKFTKILNIKEK